MPNLNKETVLKILIAIGIVAIAVSLYFQYGSPYFHERSLQVLDEKRISDLDSLSTIIGNITQKHVIGLGEEKTVYISLPSDSSTCTSLSLPSLPDGWNYHCVSQSDYKNTDGTGWIPINFQSFKVSGMDSLPVDPINNADTLNYYAFVTNSAATSTQYVITATLNNKKYLHQIQVDNNEVDPSRFAVGNNFNLWSASEGLVGYWAKNNTSDDLAADESGYHRDLIVPQNLKECPDHCLKNTNTNISSIFLPLEVLNKIDNFSYSFQFKVEQTPQQSVVIFNPGKSRLDVNIEGKSGALFVWYYDNENSGHLIYKSDPGQFIDSNWHQILVSKGVSGIQVHIDNESFVQFATKTLTNSDGKGFITLPKGFSIKEIRMYNNSL